MAQQNKHGAQTKGGAMGFVENTGQCLLFSQLRMFQLHTVEMCYVHTVEMFHSHTHEVLHIHRSGRTGFRTDFGPKLDFFQVVPGGFPGGFWTMEMASREVPGLFRTTFSDLFGSCSGRSPGNFPGLLDGF